MERNFWKVYFTLSIQGIQWPGFQSPFIASTQQSIALHSYFQFFIRGYNKDAYT